MRHLAILGCLAACVGCTTASDFDRYQRALEGSEVYTYIETMPVERVEAIEGNTIAKRLMLFGGICATDADYCVSVGTKGEELENKWQMKRDLCSISEGVETKPAILVYKSIAERESPYHMLDCRLWEKEKEFYTDEFIHEKFSEETAQEAEMKRMMEDLERRNRLYEERVRKNQ